MDSFSEPYTRAGDDISVDEVLAQVKVIEAEHKAKGITLSGRVIHVCHYLPVTSTLTIRAGIPSPPATPPSKPSDVPPITSDKVSPPLAVTEEPTPIWTLTPRYGHAAMISGIRSLSASHEQLIIGWSGDIETGTPGERVPTNSISQKDKLALEEALKTCTPLEADPDDDKQTTYVPVWLDDKVAHGHYDGYCKASKYIPKFPGSDILISLSSSYISVYFHPLPHSIVQGDPL